MFDSTFQDVPGDRNNPEKFLKKMERKKRETLSYSSLD